MKRKKNLEKARRMDKRLEAKREREFFENEDKRALLAGGMLLFDSVTRLFFRTTAKALANITGKVLHDLES